MNRSVGAAFRRPFAITAGFAILVASLERLIVEAELIDEICLENERSLQHMK